MQVIWKPLRFGVRPYRCYRCDVLAPMLCPNIVSTRTGLNKFLQRFHGGLPTLAGCWLASCLYIYIYIYIYIKLFFALFFLQLSSIAFVGILGNTGQAKGLSPSGLHPTYSSCAVRSHQGDFPSVQPAGDVQPLVWLDGCTSAALKPI